MPHAKHHNGVIQSAEYIKRPFLGDAASAEFESFSLSDAGKIRTLKVASVDNAVGQARRATKAKRIIC